MKTQINHLVTGTTGITGTNHDVRNALAPIVKAENEETITFEIDGIRFIGKFGQSLSGKSWSWSCGISHDQFYALMGGRHASLAKKASPMIVIHDNLTVTLHEGNKKMSSHIIQPSRVTIL